MYHHRQQPPTTNQLANKTAVAAAAFASHNYPSSANNSHSNSNSSSSNQATTNVINSNTKTGPPNLSPFVTPSAASRNSNQHHFSNSSSSSSAPNHHQRTPFHNSDNYHHQQYHHHNNHNQHHHHQRQQQYQNNYRNSPYNSPYAGGSNNNRNVEDRQDVIFRKVRGILNKITPESFDKLSKELVNVGLDSPRTLRGVIYLLFDKALKDLKYSSLYAKLCQELSEKAPNFEIELGPNTFCKFLISKCEDEFQRRRKATEDFDKKNELTDEEYEQRAIAKQKMLGNIKFICELGKKRLLQEEILHECIRGLLSKKKERSLQDQAQDLECLCQIMRTIGSLLDIQASRNLMNQYFERVDMFSKKSDLPSRIRFMLRDIIDLRNNNWRPRPFQREDNVPQPLSKLREEAGYDPTTGSPVDKFGNNRNLIGMSDLSKLHGNKLSALLDDEPSFTTSTDFHWGTSYIPLDNTFDPFSMSTATSKPVQKPDAAVAPASTVQASIQSVHKSSNFRVDNPFLGQGLDYRLDTRPGFAKPSVVPQQRTIDDFAKFRDGPVTNDVRRRPDLLDTRGDTEFNPRFRPIQPGFAPYNPTKMHQNEFGLHQETRRPIEPRPAQAPMRDNQIVQHNEGPIIRRPDQRIMNSAFSQDGQSTGNLGQNRVINRPVDIPHSASSQKDEQVSVDRRNRDDIVDSKSKFSNNYRPARPERGFRGRDNYLYERSNNESDTNQNWRAGPPSSTSSATSRHSSNPPTNNEPQPISRPKPRFIETDVQERRQLVSTVDSRPPQDSMNVRPARDLVGQPRVFDKDVHGISNIQQEADFAPRRHIVRDNPNQARVNDLGENHINRPISRRPEINLPSQFERRLNISPPRSRNFDTGPINQATSYQNQGPPQQSRQNPHAAQSIAPVGQENSILPQNSQPNRRVIVPPQRDNARNQSNERTNSTEYGQSNVDRRAKPPLRGDNPSIGSNVQDLDRVSNWRKGGGGFTPAPQQIVKTPTKEITKPPLAASILPKTLPKISDTMFSLRPSHNLASARAKKPEDSVSGSGPIGENANQESATVNNKDSEGQQSKIAAEASSLEKPTTNGSSTIQDTHNKSARDFHVNKFISALSEHSSDENSNVSRIAAKVKELKIPKSYQPDCLVSAMKQSIFKAEQDRDNTRKLIAQLLPNTFDTNALSSAFKIIFEQLQALEAEIPKVKSLVAGFLSQAILDNLLSLEEVGGVLVSGRHHPLFLLCLQKLENSAGQAWLCEKFVKSKIDLMTMLPEVDRSKDRLASVLKDRCLGFLDPMLTIEPDLWEQMKDKDSSPAVIYRWIKDNVSSTIQGTPTFAHVLVTCLVRYIHSTSADKIKSSESDKSDDVPNSNESSPSSSSQRTAEIEKELLSRYQQMLQAILKDKQMQLATLYSLQSFYHGLDFPKGALLRWFHQMYDLNIVDDDIYFVWKEEINDKFPGKGQALFQVNTWLNWLAEAEAESEDDDEAQ